MKAFLFASLVLAWLELAGCAVDHAATRPSITPPTPSQQANSSLQRINDALTADTILGFVVAAVGLGLFIYSVVTLDKPLEHIGLLVGLGGVVMIGLGLTGIVLLPYAKPVIIGASALALVGGGYEVYVKFFAKPTASSPATAPVK